MAVMTTEERIERIEAHTVQPGLSDADRLRLLKQDVTWCIATLRELLVFLRGLEDMAGGAANTGAKIVRLPDRKSRRK